MLKSILRNKLLKYVVLPIIVLIMLVVGGGGWYFSGIIQEDGLRVDNAAPQPSVVVTAIGVETITLQQIPEAEEEENLSQSSMWGVSDGVNYGRLGTVISDSDGLVTRQFASMVGNFEVGDELHLDRTAYPHDPKIAQGVEYSEVIIPSELGDISAWLIPVVTTNQSPETWTIVVHGRTSNRDTGIKLLGELNYGYSLLIDYRNDEGAPRSESGYYDFGTTEWRDVESAVQYALNHEAKKIILAGFSMGGGVVVNYQLKSELAAHTVGIILEAPMLNFGRTIDKGAEERGVPTPITAAAKFFASIRYGINWSDLDFLSHANEITVPVLLIHGDADDTVPIETSIEFAAAAPNLVELHTFENVEHVAAWNSSPEMYESLIKEFVDKVR